jgi:hypothetical protein
MFKSQNYHGFKFFNMLPSAVLKLAAGNRPIPEAYGTNLINFVKKVSSKLELKYTYEGLLCGYTHILLAKG